MFLEKELLAMSLFKLRDIAREKNFDNISNLTKEEIIEILKLKIKIQEEKRMFSKEDLEKLTLEQLQIVAVSEGVEGTTKEEIINNLIEKVANENSAKNKAEEKSQSEKVEVQEPKKRGRRPKKVEEEKVDISEKKEDVVEEKQNIDEEKSQSEKVEEKQPEIELEQRSGVLDILQEGYGFLRAENCEYGQKDAYVSTKLLRSYGLRPGDFVIGYAKKNSDNKQAAIMSVESVNGIPVEQMKKRVNFDNLIPIFPEERFTLENKTNKSDYALRCIDLIAPIGKGQRAMIVSPPKAGKTTLLKKVANAITENYPDALLFVLLIDERPEEVTDMQRSITGEVIYSTFDQTPEHHTKAAELLIERAKRNVELGKDVVIIMDSLTRLARAYNLSVPPSGRTLSGGMDPAALHPPKKFFGSARNIENGGSLTIIATALVDTGSRMDDVVYEEFKGTGNMEIHLDRKLSERRIFPAIDLNKSSTRREDKLLSKSELKGAFAIRKMLSNGDPTEATEQLLNNLVRTANNDEFVEKICKQMEGLEKNGFTFVNPYGN